GEYGVLYPAWTTSERSGGVVCGCVRTTRIVSPLLSLCASFCCHWQPFAVRPRAATVQSATESARRYVPLIVPPLLPAPVRWAIASLPPAASRLDFSTPRRTFSAVPARVCPVGTPAPAVAGLAITMRRLAGTSRPLREKSRSPAECRSG